MKNKLGFFKRIYLSITDFRIYPFIQLEKLRSSILYFLKLLVVISIILAIVATNGIISIIDSVLENYDDIMPNYSLKNGILTVDKNINVVQNNNILIVDTSMTNKEYKETEQAYELQDYNLYILINKDAIEYGNSISGSIVRFDDNKNEFTDETMYALLKSISEGIFFKIYIGVVLLSGIFLAYLIIKSINLLVLVSIGYIISTVFRIRMKFSNYLRIAAYAITLPILIELITILTMGTIPEFAYITYHLLSYVYVFYAIRAIKLDNLLISASEPIKDKIENEIEKILKNKKEGKGKYNEQNKEEENKENNEEEDKKE